MSKKSGTPAGAQRPRAPSTAREVVVARAPEGADLVARAPRASRPQPSFEQELYGTCGALLGAIEALAYELPEPPPPRIERALRDARKYGQRVREHVEALAILGLGELADPSDRVPFPLAHWLNHACRGASANISALGCTLTLPALAELESVKVPLAVSRMDRALTVMLEQLAAAAGSGARIHVEIQRTAALVILRLVASHETGSATSSVRAPLSPVFVRAWERLLGSHGGAFHYEPETPMMTCELPTP